MKTRKKKIILSLVLSLPLALIIGLSVIPFVVMNPMLNQHCNFTQAWNADEYDLISNNFFVQSEDGLYLYVYEVAVENPKAAIICLSGIHNPSVTAYFGHARMFAD
ncbi:MAG: hypothetical protein FWG54_00825, partial [Bacteroidetes bacterium]|nr:hypothetical protein [Bacteroidota bacterium]